VGLFFSFSGVSLIISVSDKRKPSPDLPGEKFFLFVVISKLFLNPLKVVL